AQLAADREVRGLIDAGLNRLPDRLRVPFVLCELEGWTNAEAAAVLGCPVGTVESRLTRARHRLRGWLTVRGVTPAIALPAGVRRAMVRAAARGGAVAPAVRALADRAVPMALAAKLRALAAVVVGVMAVAAVGFGLAGSDGARPADAPP